MMKSESDRIQRSIKSFVRREGRMTTAQQSALTNLWPKYGVIPTETLDYVQLFHRSAPTWLEIGFGMGEAMLQLAQTSPEINFMGIDVHQPGIAMLMRGLEEKGLENVRVFNQDAVEILERYIPSDSLDAILIFFPDPWHKRKHVKRRLIQSGFVELIVQKLKLGAKLHLATDWEEYSKQMMNVLSENKSLYNPNGFKQFAERPQFRQLTKFEQRGQRLGHGVWDLEFHRIKGDNHED